MTVIFILLFPQKLGRQSFGVPCWLIDWRLCGSPTLLSNLGLIPSFVHHHLTVAQLRPPLALGDFRSDRVLYLLARLMFGLSWPNFRGGAFFWHRPIRDAIEHVLAFLSQDQNGHSFCCRLHRLRCNCQFPTAVMVLDKASIWRLSRSMRYGLLTMVAFSSRLYRLQSIIKRFC